MNVTENESGTPPTGTAAGPSPRTGLIMFGCLTAVFLGLLDAQIMATALPRVAGDLGGLNVFAWVATAYIIASSVTTPLYGKLGDLFGRKGVFLAAIGIFLVGSAACGWAQSIEQLLAFRVVQGIGAGGLFVSVLSVIGELFSPREGARYYGYFSIAFAGAALAGPPIGGVLTDALGWRWVFYINLPVGALAFALVAVFLRLPVRPRRPQIDYTGFLLLSAAIVALTLLTSWAGARYGWASATILGLAAVIVVAVALFLAVEKRAAEPVIPLHLFKDSTFTISAVVSVVAGFVFVGSVNFLALFLQVVTGASATMSGVILLPMMLGLVASSMISARVISHTGNYKWYPAASMGIGIISALLLATMDAGTSRVAAAGYMLLLGIAAGLNMSVLTMAAQNTAPRDDIGAVSATVSFGRMLGASLGISVFAAIFYSRLTDELARRVPAGALAGTDRNSLSDAAVLGKLGAPVRLAVEQAYAASLTPVFLTAAPVLALGLVLSVLLKNTPLRSWDRNAAPEQQKEDADQR
ncbi:MDR family MFS transporter [Streptomyces sp. H10-C2]|uniref:MDR family MFS transporter n=1 Tax=unclassified Streptomyces TaxID=2593676 RepID=UPI0024BADC3E|nr:MULTISPECIES: MDR family MFS transporter [unclassified Streptomyces]MDJ0341861.1 MDR family MFS transporter [Streptomyces sp. PH10-H1]MDJ0370385.1 MDR family MFS transporter [Streptomyces sp. H10-C2]